jgi:hypothetical protein
VFVLVQEAAEAIASADVEVGKSVWIDDRFGQRLEWSGVGDALMWPVRVVKALIFAQGMHEMPLVVDLGYR